MKKNIIIILTIVLLAGFQILSATNIFDAIKKGDLNLVKKIISNDKELLNKKDNRAGTPYWRKVTPVWEACFSKKLHIVEFLIDKGANIELVPVTKSTTLHMVVHGSRSPTTPQNNFNMIKLLLSKKKSLVSSRNNKGYTPLFWSGNELNKTYDLLIASGADINAKAKEGRGILFLWAQYFRNDRSEYLLKKGADVNILDDFGRTPLHAAAIAGRLNKSKLFIKYGAKINLKDNSGNTPLDYSEIYSHKVVFDYLVSKGGKKGDQKNSIKPFIDPVKKGEASIVYNDGNSWTIKTKNNILVFDYSDWGIIPKNPSINNGRITLDEFKDKKMTIFVSSKFEFEKKFINNFKEESNSNFVLGYKHQKDNKFTMLSGKNKKTLNGIEILSFKSNSNGTGFIVKADGVNIFYAGANWKWNNNEKEIEDEINYIKKETGNIDIMILPLELSSKYNEEWIVFKKIFLQLKTLNPKLILPSLGDAGKRYKYKIAAEIIKKKYPEIIVKCVKNRGERLLYSKMEKKYEKF